MSENEMKFMDDSSNAMQLASVFMLKNKGEKMKISDIAKKLGYAESSLKNEFTKKKTGITIAVAVRNFRLVKAIDMLIHSNKTINAIAVELDYTDYKSLSKQFKEYIGVPPTEFREIYPNIKILEEYNVLNRYYELIELFEFNILNLVCELLIKKVSMKYDDEYLASNEDVVDTDSECIEEYVDNSFERENFFEKVYKENPRNPLTNVLRGIECHLAGNNGDAKFFFKAAIEAAKDDTRFLNEHECNLIYAMFLHRIGDYKAAQIAVNVAQNLPDSYLANFYAGLYTLHGEKQVDFENLKSELDEYKYDQEYCEELVEEIPDEAALCEEYFSKAIELKPNFAPAYFYKAYILDCQNENSAEYYKKASELDNAFSVIIE